MTTRMVTLQLDASRATLADVQRLLGLRDDEVDRAFGVVSVSPRDALYAIRVHERVAERLSGHDAVRGMFSDPPIEPTGPR